MKVPFVDLRAQHQALRDQLQDAFLAVLDRADFALGEDVACFEAEFAALCGTNHAVGVASGLAALELALRAYGIGPGDEVIVPAHTFVATAAAVTFAGAQPVLVDIDPSTFNLDAAQIESALSPRTRAIIPVHLYGLPAPMDPIMALAERHHLIVIEDACQAHGAAYRERRTGALGHAAAFSFYPTKNLGGCGDGGMVVTDDLVIAERIRALRNCGQRVKNEHELFPFNARLDTLQAALLRVKLRSLERWNSARRDAAHLYDKCLQGAGLLLPQESPDSTHVYHLYVVRTPERDALRAYLQQQGIGTAIHYPRLIHQQPFYVERGIVHGRLDNAEQVCREIVSLPMYPEISAEQVRYVAAQIREFLRVPAL
ncbi:MAG TPA: DegT/DnrJ/EryC1/StrS family aminotransferase [Aggregatilineaceae bacterium]|nr:DegT/DnrJ/EryC1/StrS family aminotransferase [Aggregatilineaceae bacterium]